MISSPITGRDALDAGQHRGTLHAAGRAGVAYVIRCQALLLGLGDKLYRL